MLSLRNYTCFIKISRKYNAVCTMNTRDLTKEEAEVISMEEYLAKRKKIRENERKHKKKGSDDREESLMPLEFYMVSSLAWS